MPKKKMMKQSGGPRESVIAQTQKSESEKEYECAQDRLCTCSCLLFLVCFSVV